MAGRFVHGPTMARDIEHRWASARKAVDYGVNRYLQLDVEDGARWLRRHVESGAIKVMFDNVEITPVIAQLILRVFDIDHPEETIVLPADFLLYMPDVRRVAGNTRRSPPSRRGRPRGAGSFADADRGLVRQMNMMIANGEARSPSAAARTLVSKGLAAGHSTDDAKVRRLVGRYKHRYGDDR